MKIRFEDNFQILSVELLNFTEGEEGDISLDYLEETHQHYEIKVSTVVLTNVVIAIFAFIAILR